ncbi:MAG: ABC transporter ATP-binding protein, partial [Lachnospiraceae bacterium]|nr:ABC transporter ATP-binding protein [Lachnospiraceae bacterium]
MKRTTLRKVMKELRPFAFEIAVSFLLAVATVVSSLYIPILIGNAVDTFVGEGVRMNELLPILGRMGGVIAVTALCQWFLSVVNNRIVYHVSENLRVKLFRHLMKLPLSYLDRHASGDIQSRMVTDVDQLTDGLLMGFTQLFTGILTIIGTLIFMLTVNVFITIGVVLMTPASILLTRFIAKKTHKYFEAQAKSRGEETSFIQESVSHEKVIKAYSRERAFAER